MIQTNEYALTRRAYLKILVLLKLKSYWWLYEMLILLSLLLLPRFEKDPVATFIVAFNLFYIPGIFIYLYYYVTSKDNRNVYRPHQLTFTTEKIIAYSGQDTVFDTPTTNEVALNQIIRVREISHFWLLYLAKHQFVVIPKEVFKSSEDQEEFKRLFHL